MVRPSARSRMNRSAVGREQLNVPSDRSSPTASRRRRRGEVVHRAGGRGRGVEESEGRTHRVGQHHVAVLACLRDGARARRRSNPAGGLFACALSAAALLDLDGEVRVGRRALVRSLEFAEREPVGATSPSRLRLDEQPGRLPGREVVDVVEPDVAGLEQPVGDCSPRNRSRSTHRSPAGRGPDACIRSEVLCRASPAIRAAAPSPRSACRSRVRRRRSPPGRVMCRTPECGGRLLRPRLLFRPHGTGQSLAGAAAGFRCNVTPAAAWCQQERERGGARRSPHGARPDSSRRRRGIVAPGDRQRFAARFARRASHRSTGAAAASRRRPAARSSNRPAESGTSRGCFSASSYTSAMSPRLLATRNCS